MNAKPAWWLAAGLLCVLAADCVTNVEKKPTEPTDASTPKPESPPPRPPAPPPPPAWEACVDTRALSYAKAVIGPTAPCDVGPADKSIQGDELQQLHASVDYHSWMTFVALNWPALPDGSPDPGRTIGQDGDNATVWESWKQNYDTFLSGGKDPGAWDSQGEVPAACQALFKPGTRVFRQVGKTPNVLEVSGQPFKTGPLVDQLKGYARYAIQLNRPMYEFIRANKLYSKAGQAGFGEVSFACGANPSDGGEGKLGPIVVKSAWKLLDPKKDDASRFHTASVLVYTPPSENPRIPEKCEAARVGLVGFHIAHKTVFAPQWIWSTFEQVDNVPDVDDVKAGRFKDRYNFYKPRCKGCTAENTPPPRPWVPNARTSPPSQIVREIPIAQGDPQVGRINAQYQAALKQIQPRSVWQHYELIGTQWPTRTTGACSLDPAAPNGNPTPLFLANSTLESYIQGKVPNVSSSCIECHGNAVTTSAARSDFTYLLQLAQ
jgi:hypothetical protein